MTGISTTGVPHLGNYVGAIRSAVEYSHDGTLESFYFLADYHALVKCRDAALLEQSVRTVAASWLALGLNTDNAVFYRQSDIPGITELNWILSVVTAKGLMNRAHAYKAAVDKNTNDGEDADHAITMGLFSYPMLMAADILLFNAHRVPVGSDQVQHIEMARDIAQRFNHHYGEHFLLPQAELSADGVLLSGLDGRKMSKSYDNTIPLFCPSTALRKLIMKIKTNSLPPEAPKSTEGCPLYDMYRSFASAAQVDEMAKRYQEGVGWGEVKEALFQCIDQALSEPRRRYQEIIDDSSYLGKVLSAGAERARAYSDKVLRSARQATGIRALN